MASLPIKNYIGIKHQKIGKTVIYQNIKSEFVASNHLNDKMVVPHIFNTPYICLNPFWYFSYVSTGVYYLKHPVTSSLIIGLLLLYMRIKGPEHPIKTAVNVMGLLLYSRRHRSRRWIGKKDESFRGKPEPWRDLSSISSLNPNNTTWQSML